MACLEFETESSSSVGRRPIVNYSIVQGGWTHGGTHIVDVDMGAYEAWDPALLFRDGFETGGTWNWDHVVGEP